jgi:hypothetical protein
LSISASICTGYVNDTYWMFAENVRQASVSVGQAGRAALFPVSFGDPSVAILAGAAAS